MENTNKQIRFTELGKSYWNREGAYDKEYQEMYDRLVPSSGSSETLFGELIRAISRLSYDYYNNGNCNAADVSYTEEEGYEDEETGEWIVEREEEQEVSISEFYKNFIDLIGDTLERSDDPNLKGFNRTLKEVEEIIIDNGYGYRNLYKPEDEAIYSKMCDYVMYFVLNHPEFDRPLAEIGYYGNKD